MLEQFKTTGADNGEIGGTGSHEFQVLAGSGEDAIAISRDSDYAANVEMAEALAPATPRAAPAEAMKKIATPGKHTCEDVSAFLGIPIEKTVKSIVVMRESQMIMLLVRGDHMLNEVKASKVPGLRPFRFATDAEIRERLKATAGSLGPVGNNVTIIADRGGATAWGGGS